MHVGDTGAASCVLSCALLVGCGSDSTPGQTADAGSTTGSAGSTGDGAPTSGTGGEESTSTGAGDDATGMSSETSGSAGESTNSTSTSADDASTSEGTSADGTSTGDVDLCGNGVVDAGEACDDGNQDADDGCLPNCATLCFDVGLAPASPSPQFLTVLDLEDDGWPDVYAAAGGQTVLHNDEGTLSPISDDGTESEGVAAIDVNGDGTTDIVRAGIQFRYYDGDFTWTIEHIVDVPGFVSDVAAGDVDADGAPDVVSIAGLDTVWVHHESELGVWTGVETPIPDLTIHNVELADLDDDGDLDAIVDAENSWVVVLLYDELTGYDAANANTILFSSIQPIAADVDGDGTLDLVGSQYSERELVVAPGNGDGTFGPIAAYPTLDQPVQSVAFDPDDDGDLDIAMATNEGVEIALNAGDGTFPHVLVMPRTGLRRGIVSADFDQDGDGDLVVGGWGNDLRMINCQPYAE